MTKAKRCLGIVVTLTLTASAFGAWNDRLMRCSTVGPDRYADGTRVKDGECYALVHTLEGRAFAGFNADGTCVSTDSVVVAVAPIARDGHCPRVLFQVPRGFADEHRNGRWELYLLDTRRSDGRPAGLDALGTPTRINRWGTVPSEGETASVRAARPAALPSGTPLPRITSIRVKGGKVSLTVEKTVPYLTYEIVSGTTPDRISQRLQGNGTVCDGDVSKPIIMETDEKEGFGYYRVARKEI